MCKQAYQMKEAWKNVPQAEQSRQKCKCEQEKMDQNELHKHLYNHMTRIYTTLLRSCTMIVQKLNDGCTRFVQPSSKNCTALVRNCTMIVRKLNDNFTRTVQPYEYIINI
jgi:hypothetical protein